jgi:hypothetical protein
LVLVISPDVANGQVASLLMLSPREVTVPLKTLQFPPVLFATMLFWMSGSQPVLVLLNPPPADAVLLLIVTFRSDIVTGEPSPFVALVAEWRTPPPADPPPPVIVLSLIVTFVRVAL